MLIQHIANTLTGPIQFLYSLLVWRLCLAGTPYSQSGLSRLLLAATIQPSEQETFSPFRQSPLSNPSLSRQVRIVAGILGRAALGYGDGLLPDISRVSLYGGDLLQPGAYLDRRLLTLSLGLLRDGPVILGQGGSLHECPCQPTLLLQIDKGLLKLFLLYLQHLPLAETDLVFINVTDHPLLNESSLDGGHDGILSRRGGLAILI